MFVSCFVICCPKNEAENINNIAVDPRTLRVTVRMITGNSNRELQLGTATLHRPPPLLRRSSP